MADYNLKAEITADASGYEAGVKKAEKASKKLSTTISGVIKGLGKNGLVGALGAVGLASQGLSSTLGTVVKVARKVSQTVNECTNAYKTQLIAERELDTAIQNNPFVTGASADALKQFASEMQKVSNYGDEELIPMMANLVSLGRTEAETMQIMSVAMDMSAGMGISLDSAITQLNATLNGNIGRLGQQNAELKNLSDEELRSGRAIEILGEKFKGLSSVTADTSKQLQNIKGDFKEALGQFTLPSSDMWNKFWAGFYTRGIEAINKINAFMDSQIIGKKLANAITEQIARINPADIGGRVDYTRSVLKVIGDDELEALKNYLSGLKKLSAEQEIILKRIKAEEDSRYQSTLNAKAEAEKAKERADAEAQITAELQKQEELNKKKTDWASKLLDQRIEMLEAERDRAMQLAEAEGRETYTIWRDYNEKILELKLEKLEKEKEKALAEEGLTAEDKIAIEEYYSGETKKIYNELGDYKKKKGKEEEKDLRESLKIMLAYMKQFAQNVASVFSKIASTIKNVFSAVGNIFTKVFEFNPDEALDNLLKFEDSVLTFFVETVPKLPQFFASAFESIATLIKSVMNIIDFEQIASIIGNIAGGLFDLITEITKNINANSGKLMKGLIAIVKALVQGLANWIESGGWKEFLDLILLIQTSLETAITENIDEFVDTVAKMLPDLVDMLIKSIVSASRTLGKISKSLLPLIAKIITAIINVITSNEVVQASIEAVEGLVEGLIPAIVEIMVNALPTLINFFLIKLPSYTPQLLGGIINGLIKGIEKLDFGQLVDSFFNGFINAFSNFSSGGLSSALGNLFKKVFSIEFFVDTMKNLASALTALIVNAIKSLDIRSLLGWGGGGSSGGGFDPLDIVDPVGIRHIFGFANGTNAVPKGLAMVGEAGPELVKFRGGEQVLNNRNTNKALAEMGKATNNFNVTFNNLQDTTAFAMMNQLKAYNRQLAINGVI